MTFPRLTDDPSKVAFRSMLRKAREDALSPEARRRIEAALLASPIVIAKPPVSSLRGLLAKGVLGLSALALVATAVTWRSAPAPRASSPPPVATATARAAEIPGPAVAPAEEPTLSVHDLPEAKPALAQSAPPRTPAAVDDDSLGREAALLRAAREDVVAGRNVEALRKLDRYDQRFHGAGAMGEEARKLRSLATGNEPR